MKTQTSQRLLGKVVLVTGASRGIGLAIAHELATEGCDLVISGRNQSMLNKAAKELAPHKVHVMPVVCDVRDPQAVAALFAIIKTRFRRLDILINNAGVAHPNLKVQDLALEIWTHVIETNLTSMFAVTRAALPLMTRGGAIVNNLSIAAKKVFAGSSAYNASKHGGLAFTSSLREELRPQGIRVIALLPGATDTDIWNTLSPEAPRKKMMSPESVAQAVVNALTLTKESTLEELVIRPSAGIL